MSSASDDTIPLSIEEMAANAANVAMAGSSTSQMLESASSIQTRFAGSLNATDNGLQQLLSLPDQDSSASGSESRKDSNHVTGSTSAAHPSTTTTLTGRPSRTRKLTAKAATEEQHPVVEERPVPVKLPAEYRYLCPQQDCSSSANNMSELRRHVKKEHSEASMVKEEEVQKIGYLLWLSSDNVPRATYNKYKHLIPSAKAPTASNPLPSTGNDRPSKRKAIAPLEKATRKKKAAVKTQPQTQPSVAGQPLLKAAQPEWPTYIAPSANDQPVTAQQPSGQKRGGKRQADDRLDAPSPKKLTLAITSSPPSVEPRCATAASTQQASIEDASATDRSKSQTGQEASPSRRLILKVTGARRTAKHAEVEPEPVTDGSPTPEGNDDSKTQAANGEHGILSQALEDINANEVTQHGYQAQDQTPSKSPGPTDVDIAAYENESAQVEVDLEQPSSQALHTEPDTLVMEPNVRGNIPIPILNQLARDQAQSPADRQREARRWRDQRVRRQQFQEKRMEAARPKTQQHPAPTRVTKPKKKSQPTGKLRDGSRHSSYIVANHLQKGMPTGQQLYTDYVYDPVGPTDVVTKSSGKGKQPAHAEGPEKGPSDIDADLQTMEEEDQQELADAPRSFPHEEAAKALMMLRENNDSVLQLVENHVPEPKLQVRKVVPPKMNETKIKNSLAKRVSSVFLSEVKQQSGIDPQTKREDLSRNHIMQAATLQLDDVHDEIEDIEIGHQRQTNGLYAEKAAMGREMGTLRGEVDYQGSMITAQALELREQDEAIDTLKAASILKDLNTADQQSELRRLRRLEKMIERAQKFENW